MSTSKFVTTLQEIGKGTRKLAETADALVELANVELDYSVKGVAAGEATRLVTDAVGDSKTRQNNPDGSKTDFGSGFGSVVSGVANRLRKLADSGTPDYLALAVQAASTAHTKGEIDVDAIMRAIESALMVSDEIAA